VFYKNEKTGIFIDAANNYHAFESAGVRLDYEALLNSFQDKCQLVTIRYYSGISDNPKYKSVKSAIDWLSYNGYVTVTKPVRVMEGGIMRANMDVEIAVDVMAACPKLDHVVLFTGDGDFVYLLQTIQRLGVKVSIVSGAKQISDDLKRQADRFFDVSTLSENF
jgi:uncharacterized LabA/DUF88 family protein